MRQFILKKQGVGVSIRDLKEEFSQATGDEVDWHSTDAAFDVIATDQNSQRIQSYYQKNSSGNPYYDEEEKKKKEEEYQTTLRAAINTTERIIHFSYNNPELEKFNGYGDSQQWQNFANQIYDKSYELGNSTLLRDAKSGTLYVPVQEADGTTKYYKVTDTGLVEDPAIGILDAGEMEKITQKTGPNGELELYANSRKLDQQDAGQISKSLKNCGLNVTAETRDHDTLTEANNNSNDTIDLEFRRDYAKDFLKEAEKDLAANGTRENFLKREERVIELKMAEAKLTQIAGETPQERKEAELAVLEMNRDLEKMQDLKSMLAKASPEEAEKIMAANFGDRYNTMMAQQSAEKMQSMASYTPATAPASTNTAPQAPLPAAERTVNIAPSGLKASVDLSSAFQNAGNMPQPAPATELPLSPGVQKIATDPMSPLSPGARS